MTFLDELNAVREQVLEQAEKTLPVPGSAGKMAVKFRAPSDADARDRLTGVVAAYRVGGALSSTQEKQLIVDCCDEILVRNGDGELHRPDGDGPLRFDASDERWGETVTTAHECVVRLYNLDTQPLAAAGVADNLIDWLQGLDVDVRRRVEGESDGGATPSSPPPA